MERYGVLVKDGVVVNSIVWGDSSAEQFVNAGYDRAEETTDMSPRPGMYWTWTKKDGYRPPKPFASWVWNGVDWDAPVEMPSDGGQYEWNETTQSWDLLPE